MKRTGLLLLALASTFYGIAHASSKISFDGSQWKLASNKCQSGAIFQNNVVNKTLLSFQDGKVVVTQSEYNKLTAVHVYFKLQELETEKLRLEESNDLSQTKKNTELASVIQQIAHYHDLQDNQYLDLKNQSVDTVNYRIEGDLLVFEAPGISLKTKFELKDDKLITYRPVQGQDSPCTSDDTVVSIFDRTH